MKPSTNGKMGEKKASSYHTIPRRKKATIITLVWVNIATSFFLHNKEKNQIPKVSSLSNIYNKYK